MSIRPKYLRCGVENVIIKRKSFITGGADAEAALPNPEGNPCHFTFELVLTDTDEVLYTSRRSSRGECCDRAGRTVTHSGTSCSTNC